MTEQKNLILAVAISLAIIVGFEFLWPKPEPQQSPTPSAEQVQDSADSSVPTAADAAKPGTAPVGGVAAGTAAPQDREAALEQAAARVEIDTPALSGSIALTGTRFDDLTLKEYREAPDPGSPNIVLLSPKGTAKPYYAEFGFVAGSRDIAVPGPDTTWQAQGDRLTPDQPLVLTWDNGQGLIFTREISVDEDFMFTVRDTVENTGDAPVTLFPYGLISRGYTPETLGFYILHEGPLGVFDGTLKEIDYDDLRDDKMIEQPSTGGWIGITDKYWLTALDLSNETESKTRFVYQGNGGHRYQVDFLGAGQQVAPGGSITTKTDFFAGAKEVKLLDHYAETYNIDRFDLAVDFGWFYFLTKPFFYALDFLYGLLGNFGLAIIAFTVAIKLVLFPLANKSYKSMSKMKRLQPKMKELQERFGDDRQRLNQEMMALYKQEGANPVSGCLPILIQIPIFFSLYKVLFVSIEMRHAPFFGWIKDLSAPDPTTMFNLFGLIPWDPPSFLHIGVWPLIMGLTMWLQQKMNPAPPDPVQARIMMFLPVLFTVMLAGFPAGLVIYWACNNILSVGQQWLIMRKVDAAAAKAG